jgi:hypothetical protein
MKSSRSLHKAQKRINSASTRELHTILNRQQKEIMNSTKYESAFSQTNYNPIGNEDPGTVCSPLFRESLSTLSNTKLKRKESLENFRIRPGSSKVTNPTLFNNFSRFRPTTAKIGSNVKKPRLSLVSPSDNTYNNNYIFEE